MIDAPTATIEDIESLAMKKAGMIEDPALKSLERLAMEQAGMYDPIPTSEDIFATYPDPTLERKTWGQWWKEWKDFGVNITIGGVKVSAAILNTLSNITSRKEMSTYLTKLSPEEAKKLPKDVYQSWVELNVSNLKDILDKGK